MFQKAISCYEKALAVSTQNFSAFAGLAYTYHLQVYSQAYRLSIPRSQISAGICPNQYLSL